MIVLLSLVACDPGSVQLGDARDSGSALSQALARLDAVEARLDAAEAQLDAQAAANDALSADLADLAGEVDALPGGTVGGEPVTVQGRSEPIARGGGTGASWEAITSEDVSVYAPAGATIVSLCTLTNVSPSGQYRMTVEAADGSWSNDAEATGDYATATLTYSGEAATVPGFWTVPTEGDYTVACEGRYAGAYDVTVLVFVVPA